MCVYERTCSVYLWSESLRRSKAQAPATISKAPENESMATHGITSSREQHIRVCVHIKREQLTRQFCEISSYRYPYPVIFLQCEGNTEWRKIFAVFRFTRGDEDVLVILYVNGEPVNVNLMIWLAKWNGLCDERRWIVLVVCPRCKQSILTFRGLRREKNPLPCNFCAFGSRVPLRPLGALKTKFNKWFSASSPALRAFGRKSFANCWKKSSFRKILPR